MIKNMFKFKEKLPINVLCINYHLIHSCSESVIWVPHYNLTLSLQQLYYYILSFFPQIDFFLLSARLKTKSHNPTIHG